jgi:ABC-type bacteriocin/lantibiotic exporter with double-glycine peptidase domain
MKVLIYPETRQVFNFDCGSNGLASTLVYAGVEEREDRIALLAKTTKNGTGTTGVLRVYRYYGLPHKAGEHMRACHLRAGIDQGWPTILTLQAYRESNRPYSELWQDGHWVVAIGYDAHRIIFEDPSCYHRTWLADEELHERWHDIDRRNRIRGWGCTLQVSGIYQHGLHVHMD